MPTFNPQDFILAPSFYDTLKNDAYKTASVTVPSAAIVAAGNTSDGRGVWSTDLVIGAAGALADVRVESSKDAGKDWLIGGQLHFTRTGDQGNYDIFTNAYRLNSTTLRLEAVIVNPYGVAMTGEAGNETFTFKVRTYKSPFA